MMKSIRSEVTGALEKVNKSDKMIRLCQLIVHNLSVSKPPRPVRMYRQKSITHWSAVENTTTWISIEFLKKNIFPELQAKLGFLPLHHPQTTLFITYQHYLYTILIHEVQINTANVRKCSIDFIKQNWAKLSPTIGYVDFPMVCKVIEVVTST